MIKFHNISKKWQDNWVLKDMNMEIPEGACFSLVGMSGSGKSLTSKLILGLELPTSGNITIDNEDTSHFSQKDWQNLVQKFGIVFQNAALFSSLTIFENIGIRLLEERKISFSEIQKKVAISLEKVGLGSDILNKFPDELSGGMRKRVGIARAIIHEPKYLIYDEPTTGLDPINANLIDELIAELAKEKERTSIVITHDLHTVKRLGGTIAMLHEQHIYFQGTISDFLQSQDKEIVAFLSRK